MPESPSDGSRLRPLLLVVAAAYTAVGFWTMFVLSPRVPYADTWRFLATFLEREFPTNVLTADNGHREVITNCVRVAELQWFYANQLVQIGVGMTLVAASLMALLQAWRLAAAPIRMACAAIACIGLLWLGNERKLAHGSESAHLGLVLLSLIAGLRLLSTLRRDDGPTRAWGAAGLGILATLSFGSGVACFAAFAAVLALQRVRARLWLPIAIGSAVALGALLLGGGGAPATAKIAPLEQLDQLMRWLGAPFVWAFHPLLDVDHAGRIPLFSAPLLLVAEPIEAACGPSLAARWPAFGFGAAGVIWLLLASLLHRRDADGAATERLALGLAWFGFVVGGLVVALRLSYFQQNPDQLTSSRYVPWSMMFWSGLLLSFLLRQGRSGRTALLTALAIAIAFAPSQVWLGRQAWKQLCAAELTALGAATGVLDRDFPLVESTPADIDRVLPLLRSSRKAMFAWPETALLGTTPPAELLEPVPLHDATVTLLVNHFATEGSSAQFRANSRATRLLLLDDKGAVRGLAVHMGRVFFGQGEPWRGWLQGTLPAANLRAAALR